VDQLLLLARFENQKQTLKIEKVYLNTLILDELSRFSSVIESNKIAVETQFSKNHYVKTDPYLVSIIIQNLVSNALKYSTERSKLTIQIIENYGKMECHIIDSGIGIPEEDLKKIFNQFYRSKSNEHPEIKGSGLGLSIVRRLCLLLGIDVKIVSKEQQGTTVILSFH
jgi:signal transduction histidine kinase